MSTNQKIYIAAAAATLVAITLLSYAWSDQRIAKLESQIADAKADAYEKQQIAAAKEREAAEYKQKIEYLETKLTEVKQLSKKQDEELEKRKLNSRTARRNVDTASRTRTITATVDELCRKLAELGHACE